MKKNLLLSVLVIVLALSACAPAPQSGSSEVMDKRTLSVNGTGTVTLSPDLARISIGVQNEDEDAAQAVSANNALTQKVIDAIKTMGVSDKDITTINFSIWPRQDYNEQGQVTKTVYNVQNTVYVTVRELETMGEILNEAVKAGANNIYGIQFDVEDRESTYAQALEAAMGNARTRAEVLAEAAEVEVGEVQYISTNVYGGGVEVPYIEKGLGYGGAAADVPISAGEMTITVEVSVVYEIR
jgi:uncharacterized protein YggE